MFTRVYLRLLCFLILVSYRYPGLLVFTYVYTFSNYVYPCLLVFTYF